MFLPLANSFTQELAFQEGGIHWETDWWKLILIGFSALLFLFLSLRLALYILRIVGVILCVIIGTAGGWASKILFTEDLARILPEEFQPYAACLASAIGFVVVFYLAALVMALIRKPVQPQRQQRREE